MLKTHKEATTKKSGFLNWLTYSQEDELKSAAKHAGRMQGLADASEIITRKIAEL